MNRTWSRLLSEQQIRISDDGLRVSVGDGDYDQRFVRAAYSSEELGSRDCEICIIYEGGERTYLVAGIVNIADPNMQSSSNSLVNIWEKHSTDCVRQGCWFYSFFYNKYSENGSTWELFPNAPSVYWKPGDMLFMALRFAVNRASLSFSYRGKDEPHEQFLGETSILVSGRYRACALLDWKDQALSFGCSSEVTLFFGNPGKGKSALANCLAQEILFESGPTMGVGLTTRVAEKRNKNGAFIDTPGLADVDIERRRAAAGEICLLLNRGGKSKIIFVVTEQQSRIQEEDKTTMKIVLDSSEQIGNNYGIIVNQCGPWLMMMCQDESWRCEFEANLLAKLPHTTQHIFYCPLDSSLDHAHGKLARLTPEMRRFFHELPVVNLRPNVAKDIVADDFHSICQKLQLSQEELQKQQRRLADLEKIRAEFLEEASVSRRLGIRLDWVLQEFPQAEQFRSLGKPVMEMNFRGMAPLVAYGERAFGKGKMCPRDKKLDCSIVDALREPGFSNAANIFISWVWQYDLKTVLSALRQWLRGQQNSLSPDQYLLWWCFFQNNQFRILQSEEVQSTDTLRDIFGNQLRQVGRMVSIMNRAEDSDYLKRIWCVFEIFVAQKHNIPIEVALPEEATAEVNRICQGGIPRIRNVINVNVAEAKATAPQDEAAIKNLIQESSSYDDVNQKAAGALRDSLVRLMFDGPLPAPAPARNCCCVIS